MNETQQNKRVLILISIGIACWGFILGIGAWLGTRQEGVPRDMRRFWIVLACTTFFLSFWGVALWFRARRLRLAQREKQANANEDQAPPL